MNNYEERRAARIERLKERAQAAESESGQKFNAARQAIAGIEPGQPILVGHHSERRHRRDLARHDANMRAAVEAEREAERLRERAAAAEKNKAISSDDPDAAEKIRAKLATLEKLQEIMKAANKVVKSKKLDRVVKIKKLAEITGRDEVRAATLLDPDFCGRVGFPAYALQNNNANINRLKKRLQTVEHLQDRQSGERVYKGVKVEENAEENRVRLHFDGKPSEADRAILKRNGYKWSRFNGAWQRYLSSTPRAAVNYVLDQLDKCSDAGEIPATPRQDYSATHASE